MTEETYDTVWKDKLLKWGSTSMTYDAVGNMLTKGTTKYTWTQGRRLSAVDNGKKIQYFYDHTGARTKKKVDGVTTEYRMAGDLLVSERTGTEKSMWYRYDSAGNVISVTYNSKLYIYLRNVQNDIIGLIDPDGKVVVKYTYDSWGNVVEIDETGDSGLGAKNPFRYRGYYYDTETGMYYLKSRYYDPELRRFICADEIDTVEIQNDLYDKNLYAYCDNNPVIRYDSCGNAWLEVITIGAIVGAVTGAVVSVVAQKISTGKVDGRTVLIDMAAGALSGALAVTSAGLGYQIAGNAIISIGSYAVSEGENATVAGAVGSGFIGGIGGAIGGAGLDLNHQMGVSRYSKSIIGSFKSPKKVSMYSNKINTASRCTKIAARRFVASVSISSALGNAKSFIGNLINKGANLIKSIFR